MQEMATNTRLDFSHILCFLAPKSGCRIYCKKAHRMRCSSQYRVREGKEGNIPCPHCKRGSTCGIKFYRLPESTILLSQFVRNSSISDIVAYAICNYLSDTVISDSSPRCRSLGCEKLTYS